MYPPNIVYYRDNGKASDGWFYSTIEDLQESTTYGRKVQTSAINKLVGYGLLESKLMGSPQDGISVLFPIRAGLPH